MALQGLVARNFMIGHSNAGASDLDGAFNGLDKVQKGYNNSACIYHSVDVRFCKATDIDIDKAAWQRLAQGTWGKEGIHLSCKETLAALIWEQKKPDTTYKSKW